jgi:hypothetical protein
MTIAAAIVKDYSTPAIEQGLAAWSKVQGRRWIILNMSSYCLLWKAPPKRGFPRVEPTALLHTAIT